jgi:hypothetical protein
MRGKDSLHGNQKYMVKAELKRDIKIRKQVEVPPLARLSA